MTGKRIRVAVLFGGVSSEHEVSLMSVESVLANMPQEYEVLRIGITKDGRWVEYTGKNDEITSGAWEQDKSLRTAVLSPDRSHKGFLLLGSDGWELAPVVVFFLLKWDQLYKIIPVAIRLHSWKWVKVVTRNDNEV